MFRMAIANFIVDSPEAVCSCHPKTGKRARFQSNYPTAKGGRQSVGRPSAKERKPYNLDAILDVAVRVFRERGYDGSTLDDVARAAGITKASIYYHVRSKEELLARGVGRALDALFAVLDERPAKQGRAVERLKYIVHRTIEITVDELPEVALLLRVRGNTPVERRIMERRREFDHLISGVMRNAQRQLDLRADVEPRLATRLLFGMLNSITEWYRPGGGLDAPEVAEAIFRMAFEGLTPRTRGRFDKSTERLVD
jgi:AcrR family transcriptional regulator